MGSGLDALGKHQIPFPIKCIDLFLDDRAGTNAAIKLMDINFVTLEILSRHTQDISLDPQIEIFCYEKDRARRTRFLLKMIGNGKNAIVFFTGIQVLGKVR